MKGLFHRNAAPKLSDRNTVDKAREWMQKRGGERHPAFAVDTQYDPPRKQLIPTEQGALEY